ncbi:MAG TPA: DedA family protein [Gemmatimonadaceae bacterium]|nr:DedA family protein [Gemmatimonadaceae bacterium]
MTSGLVQWLSGVPLGVLYLLMALFAAVENVFPPVPADTIVALGSWLAARGQGSPLWAFLATWVGNVAGASAMYFVGRRHGSGWMRRRFPALADERGERRLRELHGKYGTLSLLLSRFIPGVRALVPPFAGALRLPPVSSLAAIAIASGVWYGLVSYLAFRAGASWSALMATIARDGRLIALGAAIVVGAGAVVWWLRARRRARR